MMLTPWGPRAVPTGGAGVAAPAWSWTLTSAAIFFFGGIARVSFVSYVVVIASRTGSATLRCSVLSGNRAILRPGGWRWEISTDRGYRGSDLLDLAEAQLDRGLPAEDLHQRLDPLGLRVDLGDGRVQRGERAVDHHDGVGDVEVSHLDGLLGGCPGA